MTDSNSKPSPADQTARYRKWVDEHHAPAEQKASAYRALDQYETLANRKKIHRDDLAPIAAAASSSQLVAWDIGTVFLARLAGAHSAAREALVELSRHKKADVRNSIVWSLKWAWKEGLPRGFVLQILRGALSDRSKKVRQQAIKVADMLQLKELVADLEDLLQTEKNKDVLKSLRFHLGMMTDGYLLEHDARNELRLTVKKESGWSGRLITQQEIDEGRLPEIIREMQNRPF